MPGPVIVIGLDAAEAWVVEKYMAEGRMPVMARLREAGAWGLTRNQDIYKAEPAFTTFMTGAWPFDTGYWGRICYNAEERDVREFGTYDFEEYPMFWDLGPDFKVCAFDMPQADLSRDLNGLEVVAWGAHSPRRGKGSNPESLYDEIVAAYGPHPALNSDNNNIYSDKEAVQLYDELQIGFDRRNRITLDLLARDQWDLFITTFGEVHAIQHQYWHHSFDHPLKDVMKPEGRDEVGAFFERVDRAIGEIEQAAGPDATLVIYSAHGMSANTADIGSGAYLAEMLYRWAFDEPAMASRPAGMPPPAPHLDYPRHMKHEMWDQVTEAGRRRLTSPRDQEAMGLSLNWQPTNWYKTAWPEMRAFALPSYSDGYVRVNLKGRDKDGIVDPSAYDDLLDELERVLSTWRCARTGDPLVESFSRPRGGPFANDPKLPDADLVLVWAEAAVTDVIESDQWGQIGPVPFFRTGSHTSNGFLLAAGPTIKAGRVLTPGETIDYAPTILSLVGAPVPGNLKGRNLLAD